MNSPFRTVLPPQKYDFTIDHNDKILLIGSCFTENIGHKLTENKFQTQINPFGILYNPISINDSLQWMLGKNDFKIDQLFQHNDLWHSFSHHGVFSSISSDETLNLINQRLNMARAWIHKLNYLVITFGTIKVYRFKKTGKIVANCHKIPNTEFDSFRYSVGAATQLLSQTFSQLKENNPHLNILLTVSPVRHLKDGLIENQRSKAALIHLCDELITELPFVHYYPSYEIMMDDLRDYRFYNSDMIHPSSLAIEYLWQHFRDALFDSTTLKKLQKINAIIKASQHRPLFPMTPQHQKFLQNYLTKIETLKTEYPQLNFEKEEDTFRQQLT